jgi:UDP-glucuronate decarboxylase
MRRDFERISSALEPIQFAFHGKTILIAGSEGFLGKLFQEYFSHIKFNCGVGVKVVAVDLFKEGYERLDITNELSVNAYIGGYSYDYIINLAGRASPKAYEQSPVETLDVSYLGTKNLLNLAKKCGAVYLGFSSSEVYGNPPAQFIPTPESYTGAVTTMGRRASYDQGKNILETLCYVFNTKYGVDTKIIRPFNVFGGNFCLDGRVIPNFIHKAIHNQDITIYGDGQQTRTFCWFSDFIVGTIKVLLLGDNKPYNIGNDNNEISMLDLAKMVEEVSGKTGLIKLIPRPLVYDDEPLRRCPDLTKAKQHLSYKPTVSLREGLEMFYESAKRYYESAS